MWQGGLGTEKLKQRSLLHSFQSLLMNVKTMFYPQHLEMCISEICIYRCILRIYFINIYIYTVYIRYTLVDPENAPSKHHNNSPQKIGLACFSCASDSLFSFSSSCRIGQKESNKIDEIKGFLATPPPKGNQWLINP